MRLSDVSHVKDLDIVVTIQLLENTPAVLFVGIFANKMGLHSSGRKVKHEIFLTRKRLNVASAITTCLSSFLVDQLKHTSRVQNVLRS